MLARIVDNKWVYIEQITVPESDLIDAKLSVKHPRAQYIDSAGFFDGVFHKFNKYHNRLARPLLTELTKICKGYGMPFTIADDRPPLPGVQESIITPDLLAGVKLYDYQLEAIRSVIHNEVGIISANTGSGKTEIMSGIVKVVNRPTVILCDMTIIVDQIKERLELREATKEVGMFYAGKRPNGQQVIVGSFQSLIIPTAPKKLEKDTPESYRLKCRAFNTRRKNARNLRTIIGKCDLLLVDECDIATSKRWKQLFWHWFKGRRRYGFSGTPFDDAKPVENLVLKEHLGSIIFHVPREEVEKNKRIIPVSYTSIAFGDETMIRDKAAYDIAMKEQMIENVSFHKLVATIATRTTKDPSYGTLILVESQPLGYALESMIEGSKFICGDHRMKERKKAIAAFESRECQVLIGGKIIKRGLDLQGGCESLIIATGGKLASDFGQKIGRAVRVNERGFAQIYDFFFLGNHYLYGHSRKRLKTIVAMEYPAKVVFKNGVVEAGKFIRSRFRRPRPK